MSVNSTLLQQQQQYNPISSHESSPFHVSGLIPKAHTGPINVARYDRLGNYLLTGGVDKTLRLWSSLEHRLIINLAGHGWDILDATISPDSNMFASCGGDKGIFVWDASTGTLLRKLTGHSQRINSVVFNEQASIVASGSYDSTVKLWDLKSNNRSPIQVLSDAKDSVTSICIREHNILVGSVDGCVRQYDVRFGSLTIDSFGAPVTCVSYSNDGQCILVSGLNSPIRLLDVNTGEQLNSYTGHIAESYRISSTLDYRDALVISGSERNGACVWNLVNEIGSDPIQRLYGQHNGPVLAVTSCPKRIEVVTAGSDGCIQWWSSLSS